MMLILAILFTVLGFLLLRWVTSAMVQPSFNRPLILHRPLPTLIINLLWLGLLGSGLYLLWTINYLIVITLIGLFFLFWIIGSFINQDIVRAKKICKLYSLSKSNHPNASEEEILMQTAISYFKGLGQSESDVKMSIEIIFEKWEVSNDIQVLIDRIFIIERPEDVISNNNFNLDRYMKKKEKRDKAIEKACNSVLGK